VSLKLLYVTSHPRTHHGSTGRGFAVSSLREGFPALLAGLEVRALPLALSPSLSPGSLSTYLFLYLSPSLSLTLSLSLSLSLSLNCIYPSIWQVGDELLRVDGIGLGGKSQKAPTPPSILTHLNALAPTHLSTPRRTQKDKPKTGRQTPSRSHLGRRAL
jgi:hypothetical protein